MWVLLCVGLDFELSCPVYFLSSSSCICVFFFKSLLDVLQLPRVGMLPQTYLLNYFTGLVGNR